MNERVGIVGYGACVPRYRIRPAEIARAWGLDGEAYRKGLGLEAKSVAAPDQDTITLSVEAARHALRRAGIPPEAIGALYVGSESHPYAVKPSGTVVAEALGAGPDVHLADLEFACKAGTEAITICETMVASGRARYALAVGADTSQGAPGDALEFSTAAGAAAFILGREHLVATLDALATHVSDTPDFWRREERAYPRHGGRFTGEPAYFHHITSAARKIMERNKLRPGDFRHVVFHQPNGKFPVRAGKLLGFTADQIQAGLLAPGIGNPYSGSSPLGLCAVLDVAQPGERILLVSYGSGAGSDAMILTATDRLPTVRDTAPTVRGILAGPLVELDYTQYARFRRKIAREEDA